MSPLLVQSLSTLLNNTLSWVHAPDSTLRKTTTNRTNKSTLNRKPPQYDTVAQPPKEINTLQPHHHQPYPGTDTILQRSYLEPTVKHLKQDNQIARQKYQKYLLEHTLHRNKCIEIIRSAFQSIRDTLLDRERRRQHQTQPTKFQQTIPHADNWKHEQQSPPWR